ncbi:MAG TPA: LD-carboxypeptidase [Desulfomonilaceae bacterium]|nr:LD-carboxypeptidase [Desulfomonilaceae bacterium]
MVRIGRQSISFGKILMPEPLVPGDTVAVIAASGPPDEKLLATGIDFVESRGFRVLTGKHILGQSSYLAGTDAERIEDLNSALRNQEVRGIFLARGGYGAMRVLQFLDFEAPVTDPKLLMGMSDVTALQLSLYARAGLVTLSGPMLAGQVAEGLDPMSEQWFLQACTEPLISRNFFPGDMPIRILRHGTAHGPILGGCLSLIAALVGTPHAPDFSGAILFMEDVGEAPYRIDRMLMQLKLAGVLDRVSGMIMGHFLGPDGNDVASEAEDIIAGIVQSPSVPIISRFPHGHALPNLTLPHGAFVRLDTEARSLIVQSPLE